MASTRSNDFSLSKGEAQKLHQDRNRFGPLFWFSLLILCSVTAAAALAPWLGLPAPDAVDWDKLKSPPSAEHWLGTDALGRDLLSRVVYGARVSLTVGFVAPTIGLGIGLLLGLLSGYYRGWVDEVIGTAVEVWMALPGLVILLLVSIIYGGSLQVVCIALGLLIIPVGTRITRAATLKFSKQEFVVASRAMGASDFYILTREILPNAIWPLLAFALLNIPLIIVAEGALSFLGLSVKAPTPSWGGLLAEGRNHLESAPHIAMAPMIAMFATVLAFNLVGDAVRRRLADVRSAEL